MRNLNEVTELCNEARDIFIKESTSGFKKTKHLPEWLNSKAKSLRTERRHARAKYKRRFKVFPRGALIFVNFGVNLGAELSNFHWAVVLNRKDSMYSQKLTVIPISSKGNRFSVEIDGLIAHKSEEYLTKLLLDKQLEFNEFRQGQFEQHHGNFENLDDFNNYMQTTVKYFEESNEIIEVAEAYQRFNKTSYAMCMDITTISKEKIMSINKYDPSGKIKVSNHTLDEIEKQISQNLFKNN